MPSEPENKMEELLRTYAAKRREQAGAPLELHPATRRLLQEEVRQQQPQRQRQREPWFGRLLAYWPRLAVAASLATVLAATVWIFFPHRDDWNQDFAKREAPEPTSRDSAARQRRIAGKEKDVYLKSELEPVKKERSASAFNSERLRETEEARKLEEPVTLANRPAEGLAKAKSNLVPEQPVAAPALAEPVVIQVPKSAEARLYAGTPMQIADAKTATTRAGRIIASTNVVNLVRADGQTQQPSLFLLEQLGQTRSYLDAIHPGPDHRGLSLIPPGRDSFSLNGISGTNGVPIGGLSQTDPQAGAAAPSLLASEFKSADKPSRLAFEQEKVEPLGNGRVTAAAPNDSPGAASGASAFKSGNNLYRQLPAGDPAASGGAKLRLRFVQRTVQQPLGRELRKATDAFAGVLREFELQQEDESVRLVDSDGSVYQGLCVDRKNSTTRDWAKSQPDGPVTLQTRPSPRAERTLPQETFPTLGDGGGVMDSFDESGFRNVSFRVIGTNQTLGQRVVVEGTLLMATGDGPALPAAVPAASSPPRPVSADPLAFGNRRVDALNASGSVSRANGLSVPRVAGRLRIGTTNEYQLDAVRVGK